MTSQLKFHGCWSVLIGFGLIGALFDVTPATAQVSLLSSVDGGDSEAQIDAALSKRVSCRFVDTPLRDVVQYFAERTGVRFVISQKISEVGVEVDQPVTYAVDDVPAEAALQILLESKLNLTLLVKNGAVIITHVEDAQSPANLVTRVYPVADLLDVVRIPAREGGGYELDYGQLIDTITTTIEPDSWSDVGGPGSIREFENSRSLVVSTRRDIHQRIAQLLVTLRKAKGLQGIRSVSLPAATEALRPPTPLRLSAPLPTPSREPAARVRVRTATPLPEPPANGGGGLF